MKQEHRKAKTKWEADRLKTIYLLGIERSPTDVAEVLLKDERTILSYYQNYKDGNIDQLLQNNYHGKEPKLSAEQEQQLVEHLRDHVYTSSLDIIQFVKITFKATFSRTGLKRLGFTYSQAE